MDTLDFAVMFLVAGILLAAGELISPGLVLLPFALGAGIASLVGFLEGPPLLQGVVFVLASAGFFVALRPIGKRLNESRSDEGIGVKRMEGAHGVVLESIAPNDSGMVRVDREEWRAESAGNTPLPEGTAITVVEVRGTRVVVVPTDTRPFTPPTRPPLEGES